MITSLGSFNSRRCRSPIMCVSFQWGRKLSSRWSFHRGSPPLNICWSVPPPALLLVIEPRGGDQVHRCEVILRGPMDHTRTVRCDRVIIFSQSVPSRNTSLSAYAYTAIFLSSSTLSHTVNIGHLKRARSLDDDSWWTSGVSGVGIPMLGESPNITASAFITALRT